MVVHRFREVVSLERMELLLVANDSSGEPMRDCIASLLAFSFEASEGGFCRQF
ncbi:MAG TPA: hypothetical protein VN883_11700 [Myxococcales bacterium]|jgi:hypothetical protein|nr:hypothetical protein [Myxococcales bacterium]